jgi:serine/threonine-protein kinase
MFRARTNMQALALVLTRSPAPVSVLRPDVPPEIERVVLRCLQKIREHRFGSVRELVQALAPYAPSWAVGNVERMLPETVGQHHAATVRTRPVVAGIDRRRAPRARNNVGAIGLAAVALAGSIAFAAWWVGRDRADPLSVDRGRELPPAASRVHLESTPPVLVEPIAASNLAGDVPVGAAPAPPPPPAQSSPPPQAGRSETAAPAPLTSAGSRKRLWQRRRATEWGERMPAADKQSAPAKTAAAKPESIGEVPRGIGAALGEDVGPLEGRK